MGRGENLSAKLPVQAPPVSGKPAMRRGYTLKGDYKMKPAAIFFTALFFWGLGAPVALADCQIGDAKLEEAILKSPQLRGPANRQNVRALRSLRDAAFTLRSYGRHAECERLLATIHELITGPSMGSLGDNDEEEAEKQSAAREPQVHKGGKAIGHRQDKGAKPLVGISELAPGLRADEIIGAEVRSADDMIVGEVRNIVFAMKDRQDYAIVASGGFFTTGQSSLVVPIKYLKVSEDRTSFFLAIPESKVRALPLMPDQKYKWLADKAWRNKNDALFKSD
jgi:hypothetical protein